MNKEKKKRYHPAHVKIKHYVKYGLSGARILLQDIGNTIGWIMKRGHYSMGWEEYEDRKESKRAYEEREWLRALERYKCIETKRIGEKLMVRLTAKGWQQALRDKIRCAPNARAGGEICIVIFDVPESERRVRNILRYILRECQFTMLQKSVWISKKDVLTELCALLQGAKLERWIRIITGQEQTVSLLRRSTTRFRARIGA